MSDRPQGFDTVQVHAGNTPDPTTGARQIPIYQSTAFVFRDAEHAAALFNLQEVGWIYSRLTNPTVAALAERIAALEGGVGGIGCSSGPCRADHGPLPADDARMQRRGIDTALWRDRTPSSPRPSGGSAGRRSWWISDDLDAVKAAVDENTRAIFCESIANPGGYITDLDAIGKLSDDVGLPLIVDNTSASPYLCRPIDFGATLIVPLHDQVPHRQRNRDWRGLGGFGASLTGRRPASSRRCRSPSRPITASISTRRSVRWPSRSIRSPSGFVILA